MKKIEIFVKVGEKYEYICTTKQSRTCREAKANFLACNSQLSPDNVKANFKP